MDPNAGLGRLTLRLVRQLTQDWNVLVLLPKIPEKDWQDLIRTEQILWNLINIISCWNPINFFPVKCGWDVEASEKEMFYWQQSTREENTPVTGCSQ